MQGDKNAADQAAVDMMRKVLATVQMDGVVVIGEGEKDVRPYSASCVDQATNLYLPSSQMSYVAEGIQHNPTQAWP